MTTILRVAEGVNLELDAERWQCAKCGHDCGSAREDMRRGMLVAERDPAEVHPPLIDTKFNFSPNPQWIRILEFYCPGCGLQMETEYLPPGHPITLTTQIDIDSLKRRLAVGELVIENGHLRTIEAD